MNLDLARWQFAITTVYHFLFVPLTIGLSLLVAGMQTAWVPHRRRALPADDEVLGQALPDQLRDGRGHRHRAGVPVRHELERLLAASSATSSAPRWPSRVCWRSSWSPRSSGLWIFGWDRLPRRLHLACIWLASIGTVLSAYFILAANSWMQHPVGYRVNDATGRAELTDFGAVLTNSTALGAFLHTITACFLTAGVFVLGDQRVAPGCADVDTDVFRPSHPARPGHRADRQPRRRCVTGDLQAQLMTEQQPMKMAAAEALYDTVAPASFSMFTIGTLGRRARRSGACGCRGVLSFMATGSFDGEVEGINDLQAAHEQTYGPGDYTPEHPGHLLDLPAHDRLRAAGRAAVDRSACGSPAGSATPTRCRAGSVAASVAGLVLPVRGQQRRLDLHRDGPPALARLRRAARPPTASPPASAPPRCSPR